VEDDRRDGLQAVVQAVEVQQQVVAARKTSLTSAVRYA
jgi:hypothetical protein